MPFYARNLDDLTRKIKHQRLLFPPNAGLSSTARDFLRKLLTKDPNLRPSASECLQHRFVAEDIVSSVELNNLISNPAVDGIDTIKQAKMKEGKEPTQDKPAEFEKVGKETPATMDRHTTENAQPMGRVVPLRQAKRVLSRPRQYKICDSES